MRGLKREPVPDTTTSDGLNFSMKSAATIAPLVTPTPVTVVITGRPFSFPATYGKHASLPRRGFLMCAWMSRISEGMALRIKVSAEVAVAMHRLKQDPYQTDSLFMRS